MENQATYDDVNLILRLYELRREEKMRKGREWFLTFQAASLDDLMGKHPLGSDENAYFRMVTTYWDMVASFVTSGVLNQELFLQSGMELLFVWEKVRDIVPAWRQMMHNPKMLGNMEKVAQIAIEYMNRGNPDAYATWSARIRGMAASTRPN